MPGPGERHDHEGKGAAHEGPEHGKPGHHHHVSLFSSGVRIFLLSFCESLACLVKALHTPAAVTTTREECVRARRLGEPISLIGCDLLWNMHFVEPPLAGRCEILGRAGDGGRHSGL